MSNIAFDINKIVWQRVETHIKNIMPGDTVLHDGKITTVCKSNITSNMVTGKYIFGDSYRMGMKPVIKLVPVELI